MGKSKSADRIVIPEYEDVKGGGPRALLVSNMPFFIRLTGMMVKSLGKSGPGEFVLKKNGEMNAGMITGISLFGVRKTEGAINVANEWLKMIVGIKAEFEIGEVSDDGVEVLLQECPLGLSAEHGRDMCVTAMATDCETVRRLGGRLEIGETIATGADCCHLTVRPR